jgi:hypothetical protein
MLLLAALLAAAQPEAPAPAPAENQGPSIVILGNDARRAAVERVLGDLARTGRGFRRDHASGMWHVGCITAWRDNPGQTEACVRARLRSLRTQPTLVINTWLRHEAEGTIPISCIGGGGSGQALLRTATGTGNSEAIGLCLDQALREAEGPSPRPFRLSSADGLAIEDIAQARSSATGMLKVAVDHLGIPRGMSGICLIQGRVLRSERGPAVSPGAAIEVDVPCGPALAGDRTRRVRMGQLGQGRFVRLHLDEGRALLHIEPAEE